MKWYLHTLHKIHLHDIKEAKDTLAKFYPHVIQVANSFTRDSVAIGALNFQDLVQAGHVGLIQAYNKVDWERIEASPNPDGELWSYLKKRIKWNIRREIDNYGSFIKVPRRDIEEQRANLSGIDKVLVNVFPKFFDTRHIIYSESFESWENMKLGELLDSVMLTYIRDPKHRQIMNYLYGLDCEKLPIKDIANMYNMSEIGIKKIKSRSLDKLRNEDVKQIIENFYQN